ncbi:MAG TPA: DUF4129 domain-containing protein [Myxococcota bacterium]|nr:DUF4129 domain-containing protein [Myxococcota bacterium]
METERIAVAVRPRKSLEAADLGFRLARENFVALYAAHGAVVISFALALGLAFPNRLAWAAGLLWWLKPLYDRVALSVLSVALLGRAPRFAETLAELPRLIFGTGLLSSLTGLRLSPTRSFYAPVLQLEGLRGAARRKRMRVLAGRESSTAVALMGVCSTFELAILLGGLQLFATFQPEGAALSFWRETIFEPTPALLGFELGLYALAICVVEPLYVAAGFTLYINRRVWLEGWDVELAFRRLERRVRAAAVALALLLAFAPASHSRAAEPEIHCKVESAEDAGNCIQGVLADPMFGETLKFRGWRPRTFHTGGVNLDWLGKLADGIAALASSLARVGIWLLVPVLLALLVVAAARGLRITRRSRGELPLESPARRGFDLRPESLPADVVAAARARFAANDPSGALSLLYRGALVELARRFKLRLPASATEKECERIARSAGSASLVDDFAALARAWLYCAYAHRPPAAGEFESLCARFSAGFGARS